MATKESFADLQKRIRETEQQLEEARQRAASMREEELKGFVEEWLRKAESLGFTVVEVVGAIRPHFPERGRREKTRADAGKKAEPKYRDPKSGETWSGRGRPAGWLKAYLDAGKKKEEFLIRKSLRYRGARHVRDDSADVLRQTELASYSNTKIISPGLTSCQ